MLNKNVQILQKPLFVILNAYGDLQALLRIV